MAPRDSKGPELRRSLALLWGGRAPGQRGPRPRLSVEQIAHAAIRIADADGLEALSMQRIAAELGYSTMSLYNHIPSKDLLLEVAADVTAGKPPELDTTGDVRRAVRHWVGALWAVFHAHPWLLRVPLDHAPMGPNQLAWLDRLLQPLLMAGLVGDEAMAAALHLITVVRGTAQISRDMTSAHTTDGEISRTDVEVARLLAEVIDPQEYPALAAVQATEAAGDQPGQARTDSEAIPADLDFSVNRFLDGIETWVATRARHTDDSR